MDPFSLLALIVAGSLTLALTFWTRILNWVRADLTPWLRTLDPVLAQWAQIGLSWIDSNVAAPVRAAIKHAWQKLRDVVLGIQMSFVEILPDHWQRVIRTHFIDPQRPGRYRQRESITDVSWDDLPEWVRRDHIHGKAGPHVIPVDELRTREIENLTLSD